MDGNEFVEELACPKGHNGNSRLYDKCKRFHKEFRVDKTPGNSDMILSVIYSQFTLK